MNEVITIVIPCKNENDNIYECIGFIAKQKGIAGTRVIIADVSDEADSLVWLYKTQRDFKYSLDIEIIEGGFPSKARLEGSKLVTDTLETSPELYKDLMFVDENKLVWFPATITLPEKGMVFVDGTSKDTWKWAAAKATEISGAEKDKYPKGQTHKMDMSSIKYFDSARGFMDALEVIGFYDIN